MRALPLLGLIPLFACDNPVQPVEAQVPSLSVVLPTCPAGQRPYVIWLGPGRGISYVCGPA